MSSSLQVLALSEKGAAQVRIQHLTPLGGRKSTGLPLMGLAREGDYVILAPAEKGVVVHRLIGTPSAPLTLTPGQSLRVEDLTLYVVESDLKTSADQPQAWAQIQQVLSLMSQPKNTEAPLALVLKEMLRITQHEKGLVMSKSSQDEYEILASHNLNPQDKWISEKLIQDSLKNKKPILVSNLIGCSYSVSQSLVATGFLSVACWPLMVQGQIVGLLLTGSRAPGQEIPESRQQETDVWIQLAALISHFRKQELDYRKELESLRQSSESGPFQTQNETLAATCRLAQQVADSDLSILIQGETGVGKEVMARWIHDLSSRKNKPFVAVNCGALPSELLESLLFGHKKGAFTHAVSDQIGKFQQADGGTIFLDEIGDLPLALQVKLLRVLNDQMVEPLGASRPTPINVRVLSATHKPLLSLMQQKLFREDLYYRLADVTLHIPSLEKRPDDLIQLAQQFLKDTGKTLSAEARQWLLQQNWPGNVRQLKSSLRRAVVLCSGAEIYPLHFQDGGAPTPQKELDPEKQWLGGETLEEAKQSFIQEKVRKALVMTEGNRTQAAQLLGVTARTLFRYLESERMTDLSE